MGYPRMIRRSSRHDFRLLVYIQRYQDDGDGAQGSLDDVNTKYKQAR